MKPSKAAAQYARRQWSADDPWLRFMLANAYDAGKRAGLAQKRRKL